MAWLAAFVLGLGTAGADEGILPSGQRIQGTLSSAGQGRLHFQIPGQQTPLLLDQLHHVRFPFAHVPPLRTGAPYRVVLPGDQHLTGELLGLGQDRVELRTAWRERIVIPRAAVASVSHAPGFVTILLEDFEQEPKAWRLQGAPVLSTKTHVSGRHSLCFPGPGQAEYTLPVPLAAGRAGITFHDCTQATARAWQIQAEFAGSAGWPDVRVRLDPPAGAYTAEVSGTVAAKGRLPRKDGWQRLEVEFGPDRLLLAIDDEILLFCRQPGAGGALHQVRLTCTGLSSGTRGGSEDPFFDDFSLARAVPDWVHPNGDPEQDEVWLLSGDQLFGNILDAAGGKIQLQASFGLRTFCWGAVRGLYFRQPGGRTPKPAGNGIRLWLRPGIGTEPDVLEGSAQRLDEHRLLLRHEVLGDLAIDRKWWHRLRALGHSQP